MTVRQLQGAGRYPDGGGLYLQITPSGGKSWIFRYHTAGRERQMGLGPLEFVSLAEAREKAILPAKSKVAKVKHHAALDYKEMPGFMASMREQSGVGVQALRFVILTAARTGEVIGADWSEIDFEAKVWTVPASRMKAGREHRVPLSEPALEIPKRQREAWFEIEARRYRKTLRVGETAPIGPVFWGQRAGKGLSNMALLAVLRRMGRGDLTNHGFRSTFRDWAAEDTAFPGEVVEMALAHAIGNKVEAAYRRGDLFEKRKILMEAWAEMCSWPE